MVAAIFGCVFGILGIFTIGFLFVPLAALCSLFGLVSGVMQRRGSTMFMALIAAILTVAGFVSSPALIVMTGAVFAVAGGESPRQATAEEFLQPAPLPDSVREAVGRVSGKQRVRE